MKGLSARLTQLLAVQERIDALRDEAVRHGGRNFADLAYANAYDGPAPGALDALRRALNSSDSLALQYTPYGGATVARRLVAESLRASHDGGFHLRDVVLTPGAMAALNLLFRAVREDGEGGNEVIILTPCWIDYPLYLENLGLTPRFVAVDRQTMRLDLAAIEAALTSRTRAIVMSQPANPSGVIYGEDELRGLADLLNRAPSRPLLVSDECHRNVVFAPHEFVSPLAFYDSTCVVYSFGKNLLLQGQRLGYAAVSPRHPERKAFAQLLERLTRIMGFCTPTALMQHAIGDLINVTPTFVEVERRRARTITALTAAGYDIVPSQATFFLYPAAPGGDDFAFTERVVKKGVMVLPSAIFHHEGHFRIALTASDEMLDRALTVLGELGGAA
jgi:aspartate aminotransferase